MALDVFLTFDGDCRQALEFYAKVFGQEMPKQIMTYGQSPEPVSEADKDRVMYADMPLFGMNMMFSDMPSGSEYTKGNNFAMTLGLSDEIELKRIFQALGESGTVYMPLEKTFFSELFGMVRDQFGVIWQLIKSDEQMNTQA